MIYRFSEIRAKEVIHSRKELDEITEHFFTTLHIPDSEGEDVLWTNQIPEYPTFQ